MLKHFRKSDLTENWKTFLEMFKCSHVNNPLPFIMYSNAKGCVELGGEDHPNSDLGTQDLVKECVFRVTVQDNQPPPEYSFKPNIIIAMITSVTAYVPKDVVLLNDREVMVEFEGEVPILNEHVYAKEVDGYFRCKCTVLLAYVHRQEGFCRRGHKPWIAPNLPQKL